MRLFLFGSQAKVPPEGIWIVRGGKGFRKLKIIQKKTKGGDTPQELGVSGDGAN
jgi:hypothetical protein